jgi:hypothetical protein
LTARNNSGKRPISSKVGVGGTALESVEVVSGIVVSVVVFNGTPESACPRKGCEREPVQAAKCWMENRTRNASTGKTRQCILRDHCVRLYLQRFSEKQERCTELGMRRVARCFNGGEVMTLMQRYVVHGVGRLERLP